MFLVFYIILSILYYVFFIVKYIIVNLLGLNFSFFNFLLIFLNDQLIKIKFFKFYNFRNLYFKKLYIEYSFYNKNINIDIKTYLINIIINANLIQNYDLSLNLLTLVKKNIKKNKFENFSFFKKNLNKSLNVLLKKKYYRFNNYFLKSQYFLYLVNISIIKIFVEFNNYINNSWIIKYSPSNFIKYINIFNINKYNILFLRKNKVFNKGRYSRNRQYYRTGVYWCLYINIVAVIGIYFWFYKIMINFGYLWWLLYIFILSFVFTKIIKYRFYSIKNLLSSYINSFLWLYFILINIISLNKIINILFFNFRVNIFSLDSLNNIFNELIGYVLYLMILLKSFLNENIIDLYLYNISFYSINIKNNKK